MSSPPFGKTELLPNPSTGAVTLRSEEALDGVRVELVDPLGRVVKSQRGGGRSTELDLRGLSAGTYLVRLVRGSDLRSLRLQITD